jgi:L-rhamnose mutarotase
MLFLAKLQVMIKKATKKDLKVLINLSQEVQALHHEMFPNIFKPASETGMGNVFDIFLKDSCSSVFIAFAYKNIPMGYIAYEVMDYPEKSYRYA